MTWHSASCKAFTASMMMDLLLVGSNLSARIDLISSIRVVISLGNFTPIVSAIFFLLSFLETFVSFEENIVSLLEKVKTFFLLF